MVVWGGVCIPTHSVGTRTLYSLVGTRKGIGDSIFGGRDVGDPYILKRSRCELSLSPDPYTRYTPILQLVGDVALFACNSESVAVGWGYHVKRRS